jgi:hypothetical protein
MSQLRIDAPRVNDRLSIVKEQILMSAYADTAHWKAAIKQKTTSTKEEV